jgi:hypothetical protein
MKVETNFGNQQSSRKGHYTKYRGKKGTAVFHLSFMNNFFALHPNNI